jgi:penicillin-binding protein 2
LNEQSPAPGGSITLTIDVELQRVLEDSLTAGLQLARDGYDSACVPDQEEDPFCPVRAVGVVLDATNGDVLAMASVPTFDPNLFVGGLSQAELDALPDGVLDNFAVRGEYAPASTFKAVTYVTAMEEGIKPEGVGSVEEPILCSARLEKRFNDGSAQVWNNWKSPRDDGDQDIHAALMRSCNVYFWELAWSIWENNKGTPDENMIQDWARELGLGVPTAVDLPFEKSGIMPDRTLFEEWKESSPFRLSPERLDPQLSSPWFGGDLLQAAVGQGSVLVTPLQLANAYAAMVNGGDLWQPRVVLEVIASDGIVLLAQEPHLTNTIDITDTTLIALRRDLQQVVNNPRGTAFKAFEDFGENKDKVGGKTGTAEIIKKTEDNPGAQTALFVAVAPIDDPKYVVVVVIERGGSGGLVAAPTAKPILQYLLNGPDAITAVSPGEDSER